MLGVEADFLGVWGGLGNTASKLIDLALEAMKEDGAEQVSFEPPLSLPRRVSTSSRELER